MQLTTHIVCQDLLRLLLLLLVPAGPLVDRYGGRSLLLLSFAASALCYVLTAMATSIPMLFFSRCEVCCLHTNGCVERGWLVGWLVGGWVVVNQGRAQTHLLC